MVVVQFWRLPVGFEGEKPANGRIAGRTFDDLYDRLIGADVGEPPTERVDRRGQGAAADTAAVDLVFSQVRTTAGPAVGIGAATVIMKLCDETSRDGGRGGEDSQAGVGGCLRGGDVSHRGLLQAA